MMALFYSHAVLAGLGLALMLCGALVARYMKKKRWWVKTHRAMVMSGVCAVIVAIILMAIQITLTERAHFRIAHSYIGAGVALIAMATLTMGYLQLKRFSRAAALKVVHRFSGRLTLLLMFVNLLIGLKVVGII
jgi:steroid 5-alpha reductase family enzyme